MISSISRFALLSTLLPCSLSLAKPANEAVAGVSEKVSIFNSESISNEGLACAALAESFPRLKSLEGIPLKGKTTWVSSTPWSGSLDTKPDWCNYYGVECSGKVKGTPEYVTVTSVNLESSQIIGTLPSEIGDFLNLEFFSVGGNYVTGTIPETIGNWNKNMENIRFFDNSIVGTIPLAFSALTGLRNIELDQNYMIGTIPDFLSELKSLEVMHFYDNFFTGTVPEWIGGMNALTRIYWDSNSLTGTIPSSVGNLEALQYLHLFSNSLVGTIPTTVADLSSLVELSLYSNKLTGTVPNLAVLSKLFRLDLHSNLLTMGALTELPASNFAELTNEGPMNLSMNCLSYPARGFVPAPRCNKANALPTAPTNYPTRAPLAAKPITAPSSAPVELSPSGSYAAVSATIKQDFYFYSVPAPLTAADPDYWLFVNKVEFIVAGALSLAPEDAVSFVSLLPSNMTYPPIEGVTNVLKLTYDVVSKTGKSTKDLQSQAVFAGLNGLYDVAISNAGLPYTVVTALMSYDITSKASSPTMAPIRLSSTILMSGLWAYTALFAVPILACVVIVYLGYRCRRSKKRKLMMLAKELENSTHVDDMTHEGMYAYPPDPVKKVASNEGPYMYPPERI